MAGEKEQALVTGGEALVCAVLCKDSSVVKAGHCVLNSNASVPGPAWEVLAATDSAAALSFLSVEAP